MGTTSPKRLARNTLSSELKFDNSALQTYHRGVGSVVGTQFGEDVSDLTLDGFLADRELRGNRFVGISLGNQTQDADFSCGQRVIGGMLGELEGGLRGKCLSSGVHRANCFE